MNILKIICSLGIWSYLLFINITTFAAFAIDKVKAMAGAWRISEKILLILSIIGGAAGGFLAMQICRHKTKTPIFKYGLPVMILFHILSITFIFII